MKISEMKQVVDLLYNEWDLGKKSSQAKGKVCAWIYLFEILEESEKIILKKDDKKVIGLCGYSKWKSTKNLIKKKLYKILKNILIHSPLIKNKSAIYKYMSNYNYIPKEMDDYFDGEISILIVDKDYRGKNIGKELITSVFKVAKEDNINNLQILTDESCSFKFYEKIGCKKVFETIISNGEPQKCGNNLFEKGYIYEKRLNGVL